MIDKKIMIGLLAILVIAISSCTEAVLDDKEVMTEDTITEDRADEMNKPHVCTDDAKNAEICTAIYAPVCGDDGVEYPSGCNACASGNIDSYVDGTCPKTEPEVVMDGGSVADKCIDLEGNWIEESKECEYISESSCDELSGTFNDCASACRNDPDAEICTRQCVIVCDLG